MNLARITAAAAGLGLALSGLWAAPASATHLTEVTLGDTLVYAGDVAQLFGSVDASCSGDGTKAYGWTLTSPEGSATPDSGPRYDGAVHTNYVLSVDTTGWAVGTHTVHVSVTWLDGECVFIGSGVAATEIEATVTVIGGCNTQANWFAVRAEPFTAVYDRNGDGFLCAKLVAGRGNIASEPRRPGGIAFDFAGVNFKDNRLGE